MKALVYHGPGKQAWEERPDPKLIKPTDAIVKIDKTTICGTDLHIMRGHVPTAEEGRILGHEGVGTVLEVGPQVKSVQVGQKVLISCITACGHCRSCQKSFFGHCEDGGWLLGNTIDGCQAEYVRIPHADNSLHVLPPNVDEEACVMLSDIFPTAYEVGILAGQFQPGKTLAVVGAGPVGLAAVLASQLLSPAEIIVIDQNPFRLEVAKSFGATQVFDNSKNQAVEKIMEYTKGYGVEVVIEAIGLPVGWEISEQIVSAGGNIAILGVHGKPAVFHLETMWKRNFTMTAGLVHTYTIPMFLKMAMNNKIELKKMISHHFKLSDVVQAYHTFTNASEFNSLKMMLTN